MVSGQPTHITLGDGLLANISDHFKPLYGRKLFLVTDQNVRPLVAEAVQIRLHGAGYTTFLLTIAAGEVAKTVDTVKDIYNHLNQLGAKQCDVVVSIGGGMVGDVAGFVAGTYLHGMLFVQIPTTLVAMVTASVGGKTGFNFNGYKNLIGLFKQPSLVIADLTTLETLPSTEFQSGLGELITIGVLGASPIFNELEVNENYKLAPLIAQAIQCKRDIVEADPYEQLGIRSQLNLGHTFGHALEILSGFSVPHGIAVAIGLHIATQLSAELGLCSVDLPDRIRRTLHKLALPTTLRGFEPHAIIEAMRHDKKKHNNQFRVVLPTAIGAVMMVNEADIPLSQLIIILENIVGS